MAMPATTGSAITMPALIAKSPSPRYGENP